MTQHDLKKDSSTKNNHSDFYIKAKLTRRTRKSMPLCGEKKTALLKTTTIVSI
jgi:hypothetical protein